MQREIKFRAWDKTNSKMVSMEYLECHRAGFRLFTEDYAHDFSLMQFTGLTDKNGREIYEGDIVRWHYMEEGVAVVKYSDHYASWEPFNQLRFEVVGDTFEVIGNVYEHPERLK